MKGKDGEEMKNGIQPGLVDRTQAFDKVVLYTMSGLTDEGDTRDHQM